VPFLFGVASAVDLAELPGPALVRMLGDLGLSDPAARALIARMRRDGQLTGTRHGRSVHYRLAGAFAESFQRVRTGATGSPWRGHFHTVLYQVPERHRAFRDALRRTAQFAGYGLLQQGVLICPEDRRDRLAGVLADAPDEAQVHFARLELPTPDAARAARTAWRLDELDALYRTHAATLRAALTDVPAPDGASLRRFADLLSEPLVDTLRATGLPPELAPPDWSLPELRRAIGQLHGLYLAPVTAYVRQLVAP